MNALIKPLGALVVALSAYASTFTPETYTRLLIDKYGADLSTSTREIIQEVIRCESGFNKLAVGKQGERGLVQILPTAHPQVTPEQAFNADFSVKFITDGFRQGHQNWWVCYRDLSK